MMRLRDLLGDRPEILESHLSGSQARGDGRPRSDIHVALYIDPEPGLWGQCHIARLPHAVETLENQTPRGGATHECSVRSSSAGPTNLDRARR